jgi:sulfate permease, SulP family
MRFWLTITLAIGFGTVILVILLRKLTRRYCLPQVGMLVALIVAASVAAALGWSLPGANGRAALSVVGNVPASLPHAHILEIQFGWIKELSGNALAVSCLGLLEALAISKAIAHETRQSLWTSTASVSPKVWRTSQADSSNVCQGPAR